MLCLLDCPGLGVLLDPVCNGRSGAAVVVDSHDWDLDILRGDLGPHPVQKLVELLNREPL